MLLDRIRRVDKWLPIAALALIAIGVFALYSMQRHPDSVISARLYRQQLAWLTVGAVAAFVCINLNYRTWPRFVTPLYAANVLLLIALLLFGQKTKGAESWFYLGPIRLQPSELAKVLFIVTFAGYLVKVRDVINRPSTILVSFMHFLIPFGLILLQPDMGTASVFAAVFLGMLFVSGIDGLMFFGIVVGFISLGVAGAPFVLKRYQLLRLLSFRNPEADPMGTGYQLIQSKIAIGSGGITGKGIFNGTQASHGFLPTAESDFMFASICEQAGLFGGLLVLSLIIFLLWRLILVARNSDDLFATYITSGILVMIAFQSAINIGMTLGLNPITGVPLPFVSYGGSSLLTNCIAIGLAMNISSRRRKIMT